MAKRKNVEELDSETNKAMRGVFDNTNHYNDIVPKHELISTGSLFLDQFLKIRSGSVIRLTGKGHELGKTSQCFVFSSIYMKTMPKSKTLYVKAEARLTEEMKERSGHTFVLQPEDWKYGTILEYCCNEFEDVALAIITALDSAYESGEHICIIIDSLDGLILKSDILEKKIGNNTMVAGVPKLTKLLFRHCAMKIVHYDALVCITGQYSTDIQLNQYLDKRQGSSSGGAAIGHQSDYILNYLTRSSGDYIPEDPSLKPSPENKVIGVWAKVKVEKSSTAVTGITLTYPVKNDRKGNSIWIEKEVADMLLSSKLAEKKGAWISFQPLAKKIATDGGVELIEQVNGLNALYQYIEENPSICKVFYEYFVNMVDLTSVNESLKAPE